MRFKIGLTAAMVLVFSCSFLAAENVRLHVIREAKEVTFDLRSNSDNVGQYLYSTTVIHHKTLSVGFDWNTGKLKGIDLGGKHQGYWGSVDGKLIISTTTPIPNSVNVNVHYHLYDPKTGKSEPLAIHHKGIEIDSIMYGYENGVSLFSGGKFGTESPFGVMFQYDARTGEVKPFDNLGGPLEAMSADKQHILVGPGPRSVVTTSDGKVIASFPRNGPIQTPMFVSNSLIFDGTNLRNLHGQVVATVHFTGVIGKVVFITLAPDLKHALVEAYTGGRDSQGGIYYVDSTAFRNYVDKLGYLFHPTTGVMNDSQVNLRQYPNLKAKVIGTLNRGKKLQVLDRSGSKQQIGSYDSYWYKVQTTDGTIGWTYGAFIDLRSSVNAKAR